MKKELQTIEGMKRTLAAEKTRNGYTRRLYHGEAAEDSKGELLAQSVDGQIAALQAVDGKNKVDWNNLEAVKARTFAYLTACAEADVYPSVMGLAVHGFGISRRRLNQYIATNRGPTAEFLQAVKDAIADVLVDASLHRRADVAQTIFQLKNHHEHRDTVELAAAPPSTATEFAPAELQRQIDALPDD